MDFSGVYGTEEFLLSLGKEEPFRYVDFRQVEGTACYCDAEAEEAILGTLPEVLPRLRWIDSGDYHYVSCLLAQRVKQPFHLVLLDHHPDNQEPAFGGVLSCGSWVRDLRDRTPFLQEVLTIGPDGCPADVPAGWLEAHRGDALYISVDKDILSRTYARTDWTQGEHTLPQLEGILARLLDAPARILSVDVCGECPQHKGATPEDLRINRETNIELQKFITAHLN